MGYLPLIKLISHGHISWKLCLGAAEGGHLHVLEWCYEISTLMQDDEDLQTLISNIALSCGHVNILQYMYAKNMYKTSIIDDLSEFNPLRSIHVDSMRWVREKLENRYDDFFVIYAGAFGCRNVLMMMRHTFGVMYESFVHVALSASECNLERLQMFHEVGWTN